MNNLSCRDFIEKPRWGSNFKYEEVERIIYDENEYGVSLENGVLKHDHICYNTKKRDFVFEVEKSEFDDIIFILSPQSSDILENRVFDKDKIFNLIKEKEMHALFNLFSFKKNLDFVKIVNIDYDYLKENVKISKVLTSNEKSVIIYALFNEKLLISDII